MIANRPKPKAEAPKPKIGGYSRTDAQRKREDWSERGELERGYDRSAFDSPPIHYPPTGKI